MRKRGFSFYADIILRFPKPCKLPPLTISAGNALQPGSEEGQQGQAASLLPGLESPQAIDFHFGKCHPLSCNASRSRKESVEMSENGKVFP
jgi:hypothetical protein